MNDWSECRSDLARSASVHTSGLRPSRTTHPRIGHPIMQAISSLLRVSSAFYGEICLSKTSVTYIYNVPQCGQRLVVSHGKPFRVFSGTSFHSYRKDQIVEVGLIIGFKPFQGLLSIPTWTTIPQTPLHILVSNPSRDFFPFLHDWEIIDNRIYESFKPFQGLLSIPTRIRGRRHFRPFRRFKPFQGENSRKRTGPSIGRSQLSVSSSQPRFCLGDLLTTHSRKPLFLRILGNEQARQSGDLSFP